MRQKLVNKRTVELLRDREFWRTRVEEKQRFQAKKKEAWEFFRRMASFKPKSQEEFEEEFRQRGDDWILQWQQGRTRKVSGRMDCRAAEESAGKRQKLGSQGAGEDGTRRFQLQKTYGVGENLRTIPVP